MITKSKYYLYAHGNGEDYLLHFDNPFTFEPKIRTYREILEDSYDLSDYTKAEIEELFLEEYYHELSVDQLDDPGEHWDEV